MATRNFPYAVTGKTLYGVLINSSSLFWYATGSVFEAYNGAHWLGYATALTESGAGEYVLTLPAGAIATPDTITIDYRLQAAGSPATTDISAGNDVFSNAPLGNVGNVTGSVTGDVQGKVLGGGASAISGIGAQTDLQTIKTRAVSCAAPVTVAAFVGSDLHALVVDASGFVTASTVSDKSGYGLSSAERSTLTTVIHNDTTDPLGANVLSILAKVGPIPTTFPGNFAALAITATGLVSMNLSQIGLVPRALDSVADAALTVGDGLVAAICAAAGKETVSGLAFTVSTPSTGSVIRNFTLDSATIPTRRS